MNNHKIENIVETQAEKFQEFAIFLKKAFEPIAKFCMNHKKLVIKLMNDNDKYNRYMKYLKRVRNRQALYNKRRVLGKVR